MEKDYAYDLLLFTYDEQGYSEPDFLFLQLKAAETLTAVGSAYVFDVDIRDYHLWMLETMPVILILFDASRRRGYWLSVRDYFRDDASRRPAKGARTVRVRAPQRQLLNQGAIAALRDRKAETRRRAMRGES